MPNHTVLPRIVLSFVICLLFTHVSIAESNVSQIFKHGNWYAGFGTGVAQLEQNNCDSSKRVIGHTACEHNEAAQAARTYGGYRFNRFFRLEAGYIDLGSSKTTFQGSITKDSEIARTGEVVYVVKRFGTVGS